MSPHEEDFSEEGDGGEFFFEMSFAAERCPGCDVLGEPGVCIHCGAIVPATDALNEETRARQAAIGPLLEAAEDLVRRFETVPAPSIPVSLGQFATAISDGDLYGTIVQVAETGSALANLKLNDTATIGGPLRKTLAERMEATGQLLRICEELGAMAPEAPGEAARDLAIAAGRHGASLLATYMRLIASPSVTAARENETRLNQLLEGIPPAQQMSALLDAITELPADDVDERVGRVLRQPGCYTDDLGLLEPALVFAAFADTDEPFLELAKRSRTYLAHLLPEELPDIHQAMLLALPAVTMRVLDRPLIAHRCARLMKELLEQAQESDTNAVLELVERVTNQGRAVFAAGSRIDRALRLLVVGERTGVADDAAVVDTLMRTYLELSETGFRNLAWFAVELEAIRTGAARVTRTHPPMLGELQQLLAASESEMCGALAESIDTSLRNSAAHAQYAWNDANDEVVDLRTNQCWGIDELNRAGDMLVAAVAGTDAGYGCFLVGRDVQIPMPSWAHELGQAYVVEAVAEASFGAYGYRVEQISQDGGEVTVTPVADHDPQRLMPALAGLAVVAPEPTAFRVRYADREELLLEVSSEGLRKAREAPPQLSDLVILEPLFEGSISRSPSTSHLLHEYAATISKVVAASAMQQLATESHPARGFERIADRLSYARQFLLDRGDKTDPVIQQAVVRLERATAASFAARSGKPQALRRLISTLNGLFEWAEARGPQWPPP